MQKSILVKKRKDNVHEEDMEQLEQQFNDYMQKIDSLDDLILD
jgi:ribosomal protein L13E